MNSQNFIDTNSLKPAVFVKRINRFVSVVKLKGKNIHVYVPNTGRLSELAIPGREVLLTPSGGKYRYKMLYIFYKGFPVMIDSAFSNKIFADLLETKRVPGLKKYSLIRNEPPYKNHRFDFLVKDRKGKEFFIELKSCTLAWDKIASFPDAISSRAVKHIEALAEAGNGILVIFILHKKIKYFVPNYHTDFEFYKTLKQNHNKIKIMAYSIDYGKQGFNISEINRVRIKFPRVKPVGAYLLILFNNKGKSINTGKLGSIKYRKGYYVYTGSGKNQLFKRIEHHKNKSIKKHWHIDYIKEHMKIIADIPIVTIRDIECELSEYMNKSGTAPIKDFGSSDCKCNSHLYYFKSHPYEIPGFWEYILEQRFGKPL